MMKTFSFHLVLFLLGGQRILIEALIPPDPPFIITLEEGDDGSNYDRFYTKDYHIRRRRDTVGLGPALNCSRCESVSNISEDIRTTYNLDPFYGKYTHAYGIPILSSAAVSDAAILRGCYVIRFLLADRQDVRDALHDKRARLSIVGVNELTNQIPEYSYLGDSWNDRSRGLGGTVKNPVALAAEENLLCGDFTIDRWWEEDVVVHEMTHTIHQIALSKLDDTFDDRLTTTYDSAVGQGKWSNTYASWNKREYLAEGAQAFFGVNTHRDFIDRVHNNISTRGALFEYDPSLYDLLTVIYPCANTIVDRCSNQSLIDIRSMKSDCCTYQSTTKPSTTEYLSSSMAATKKVTETQCILLPTTPDGAISPNLTGGTTPTSMQTGHELTTDSPVHIHATSTDVEVSAADTSPPSTSSPDLLSTDSSSDSTQSRTSHDDRPESTEQTISHADTGRPSSSPLMQTSSETNSAGTSSANMTTTISVPASASSTLTIPMSVIPTTRRAPSLGCFDKLSTCSEFLSANECFTNPVMRELCVKTCRSCAGCYDYHRLCPDLSNRGFCTVKRNYMTSHCPKSCREC